MVLAKGKKPTQQQTPTQTSKPPSLIAPQSPPKQREQEALSSEQGGSDDSDEEKVSQSLIQFDEARVSFQTSQILTTRSLQQFQIYEIRYVRGNADTEAYLTHLNSIDRTKVQTFESWGKMRRALFQIKLLVLNVEEAEN